MILQGFLGLCCSPDHVDYCHSVLLSFTLLCARCLGHEHSFKINWLPPCTRPMSDVLDLLRSLMLSWDLRWIIPILSRIKMRFRVGKQQGHMLLNIKTGCQFRPVWLYWSGISPTVYVYCESMVKNHGDLPRNLGFLTSSPGRLKDIRYKRYGVVISRLNNVTGSTGHEIFTHWS